MIVDFEGIDGLGKTTQALAFRQMLEVEIGVRAKYVKFPNGRLLNWIIRRMLRTGSALKYTNVFQSLQWLDKLIFQIFVLPFIYLRYDVIVMDRWSPTMFAYGLSSGANVNMTHFFARTIINPDVIFLFKGKNMRRDPQAADCYENNTTMQDTIDKNYREWVDCYGQDVKIVEVQANDTFENVSSTIKKRLLNL